MPHGGERTPNKPAAVSGPGKLSRRTDGGPGKRLEFGDYDSGQVGEAQRLAAMQGAAPQRGRQSSASGPPTRAQAGLPPAEDPFRSSNRPNEPVTAGIDQPTDPILPPDPYEFVRALYARHPHPNILRLLKMADADRNRTGGATRGGGSQPGQPQQPRTGAQPPPQAPSPGQSPASNQMTSGL